MYLAEQTLDLISAGLLLAYSLSGSCENLIPGQRSTCAATRWPRVPAPQPCWLLLLPAGPCGAARWRRCEGDVVDLNAGNGDFVSDCTRCEVPLCLSKPAWHGSSPTRASSLGFNSRFRPARETTACAHAWRHVAQTRQYASSRGQTGESAAPVQRLFIQTETDERRSMW